MMDYVHKLDGLLILMFITICGFAEGQGHVPKLNVTLSIWNGEVTVHWDAPGWMTPESYFDHQITEYKDSVNWTAVSHCRNTPLTYCDLSSIINTTTHMYLFRVRVVTGQNVSTWTQIRIDLRRSKLLPPIFSLNKNSSSVQVRIHINRRLKEIFKYGLKYHIFMKEKQNPKMLRNITWLSDQDPRGPELTFGFLKWGRQYCVSLTVEDVSGEAISAVSPEQCVLLPPPEWYKIMMVMFLVICILAILFLMVAFLHYSLRRPEKLPITLKSPGGGWHPLILGDVPVEVVTDKGFLLMSAKGGWWPESAAKAMEAAIGQERRASLDSGVSVDQQSSGMEAELRGESGQRQKEDSGCGSLDGAEGSASTGELGGHSSLDCGKLNCSWPQHTDSDPEGGVSRYGSARDMKGADTGSAHGLAVLCGEHPSFSGLQAVEEGGMDSAVAVTSGYRPSQLACVCAGQGTCLGCRVRVGQKQGEDTVESPAPENDLVSSYNTTSSSEQHHAPPALKTNNCPSIGLLGQGDSSVFPSLLSAGCNDITPLLITTPQFDLLDEVLDCKPNILPLSLCDMELTFG